MWIAKWILFAHLVYIMSILIKATYSKSKNHNHVWQTISKFLFQWSSEGQFWGTSFAPENTWNISLQYHSANRWCHHITFALRLWRSFTPTTIQHQRFLTVREHIWAQVHSDVVRLDFHVVQMSFLSGQCHSATESALCWLFYQQLWHPAWIILTSLHVYLPPGAP